MPDHRMLFGINNKLYTKTRLRIVIGATLCFMMRPPPVPAQPTQPAATQPSATQPAATQPVETESAKHPPPNFVLIYADDLSAGMTSGAGHPVVRTPNIDRMMSRGVRFKRCYVPTPQDAPAQASLLTGQYPPTAGVTMNGESLPYGSDTFTDRLKRAGYACGLVGKWALSESAAPRPGFGLVDFVATSEPVQDWNQVKVHVNGQPSTTNRFLTDWHTDQAIAFLDEYQDEPFFLWLSLRAPSEPLTYPPGLEGHYPPQAVDLPLTMGLKRDQLPRVAMSSEPFTAGQRKQEAELRKARSQYYAMITRIDELVGRVVNQLDTLGLADNTIVIFSSDSGLAIGDHGMYGTGPLFFEELVRVPLVFHCPPRVAEGKTVDRVVSQVDLAPTILQLAELHVPVTMHGETLTPYLGRGASDPTATGSDEAFFVYEQQGNRKYPARGLVASQFKYIDYITGNDDVLYDLRRDPLEMNNVFSARQYQAVVRVMKARLEAWRKQIRDQ